MVAKRLKRVCACASVSLLTPIILGATGPETNFDARILAAHNEERISLGVPPLRWNTELAAGAREWSNHLARTGSFQHSPDQSGAEPIGENIWGGTPESYAPEAMVEMWIAEKKHFVEGTFPANSRTGEVQDVSHYTQVVWRSSREIGCGLSRGQREEVLVCRYSEAGNVIGQQVL